MKTIQNKALLCRVTINQFNPIRKDKQITAEILNGKGATREAGKWIKNLIDPKALNPITQKAQEARIEHYRLTLPWSDEGIRILPCELYLKYAEKMRAIKKLFFQEVETFLKNYDSHVLNAQNNLKGMFNPADYPTAEQIKRAFAFDYNFLPIPCGNDFRVDLNNEEIEKIKAETEERVKSAESEAVKNLFRRLAEPIEKIAEKLKDADGIFRDSLLSNLEEILNLIPALNLTDDPNFDLLIKECREKITAYKPDQIREEKKIRETVTASAEEILERLKGFF